MEQNTPKERLNALILEKSIPNYLSTSQLIKDALGEFDQTEEYVNRAQKLVDDAIPAAMEAREADYMEACKLMETEDVNFISDENPLLLAAKKFAFIGSYKDSKQRMQECQKRYETIRDDLQFSTTIADYDKNQKELFRQRTFLISLLVLFFTFFVCLYIYYCITGVFKW